MIEFICIFDAYLCVVKSDGLSVAESICIKAHQIVFHEPRTRDHGS